MVVCRSRYFDFLNDRHPFGRGLSKPGRYFRIVRAELVEALFVGGYRMPAFRAEAASRPACDLLSFASPKESKQRKGDPQSATPSRCEGANLRRGGCGVRRRTRFAAAQRRSDSRGELDNEARALRRACHPATAPAQAQPEGAEQPNSQAAKQPHGSLLRSTPNARREALALLCLGRAKQWPEGMSAPHPRAPQVAPARSAGDADSGVALSLVTFFRRRERKLLACRATPGLRPEPRHASRISTPRLRQAQPERFGSGAPASILRQSSAQASSDRPGQERFGTIKTIAASAC